MLLRGVDRELTEARERVSDGVDRSLLFDLFERYPPDSVGANLAS
jgi:hypothetical protein